jgi:hypothetical protein
MYQDKVIIYSEPAKERLEQAFSLLRERIEDLIRSDFYVPGQEEIEVTASDIEKIVSGITLTARSEKLDRMRRFVVNIYGTLGALTAAAALAYDYIEFLFRKDPIRFALLVGGLAMLAVAVIFRFSSVRSKHLRVTRKFLD